MELLEFLREKGFKTLKKTEEKEKISKNRIAFPDLSLRELQFGVRGLLFIYGYRNNLKITPSLPKFGRVAERETVWNAWTKALTETGWDLGHQNPKTARLIKGKQGYTVMHYIDYRGEQLEMELEESLEKEPLETFMEALYVLNKTIDVFLRENISFNHMTEPYSVITEEKRKELGDPLYGVRVTARSFSWDYFVKKREELTKVEAERVEMDEIMAWMRESMEGKRTVTVAQLKEIITDKKLVDGTWEEYKFKGWKSYRKPELFVLVLQQGDKKLDSLTREVKQMSKEIREFEEDANLQKMINVHKYIVTIQDEEEVDNPLWMEEINVPKVEQVNEGYERGDFIGYWNEKVKDTVLREVKALEGEMVMITDYDDLNKRVALLDKAGVRELDKGKYIIGLDCRILGSSARDRPVLGRVLYALGGCKVKKFRYLDRDELERYKTISVARETIRAMSKLNKGFILTEKEVDRVFEVVIDEGYAFSELFKGRPKLDLRLIFVKAIKKQLLKLSIKIEDCLVNAWRGDLEAEESEHSIELKSDPPFTMVRGLRITKQYDMPLELKISRNELTIVKNHPKLPKTIYTIEGLAREEVGIHEFHVSKAELEHHLEEMAFYFHVDETVLEELWEAVLSVRKKGVEDFFVTLMPRRDKMTFKVDSLGKHEVIIEMEDVIYEKFEPKADDLKVFHLSDLKLELIWMFLSEFKGLKMGFRNDYFVALGEMKNKKNFIFIDPNRGG